MQKQFLVIIWFALITLAGCSGESATLSTGETLTVAKADGQWLVVNYWAPWCGPCRAEIPELNDLAAQAQGFEVLGVHFDDAQGELLLSDMRQLQVRFPVLLSDPALTWGHARPAVLPSTWLVDGQRTVRKVLTGPQTAEAIASALREQGVLE